MKMTKKLTAVALSTIMAVSSMISMGAFASEIHDELSNEPTKVVSTDTAMSLSNIDEDFDYTGLYTCGSSYIIIGNGTMTFNAVYDTQDRLVRGSRDECYVYPNNTYQIHAGLPAGQYEIYNSGHWYTSSTNTAAEIRGLITINSDNKAVITIVDGYDRRMQSFVQQ